MGMLLRRYHEDTLTQEVKPTTYEDVKGVADVVAPLDSKEEVVEEEKPKAVKKSAAKKK